MSSVKVDLVNDLFTVEYAGDPAPLIAAVQSVGDAYGASVISAEEAARILRETPPPPPMPGFVRAAIEQGRREGKLVAFDCYADWCAPCRKMLDEVFPHEDVQALIDRYFVLVKVNVDEQAEAAQWFRSSGIPDL